MGIEWYYARRQPKWHENYTWLPNNSGKMANTAGLGAGLLIFRLEFGLLGCIWRLKFH